MSRSPSKPKAANKAQKKPFYAGAPEFVPRNSPPRRPQRQPNHEAEREHSAPDSLNHLLNFKYQTPKKQKYTRPTAPSQPRKPLPKNLDNKNLFVRANSTVVLPESLAWDEILSNPDADVPWQYIQEIIWYIETEEAECPICLDQPLAPRIMPCGHYFCWPCLLRCLAFSPSGVNSKCPLCFYVFTSSDLLPVDLRPRHRPAVGQPFSFQRVHRIEGTCLVVPYKDWRQRSERLEGPLLFQDEPMDAFATIIRSYSPKAHLNRDRKALAKALKEALSSQDENAAFIQDAIEAIDLQFRTSLLGQVPGDSPVPLLPRPPSPPPPIAYTAPLSSLLPGESAEDWSQAWELDGPLPNPVAPSTATANPTTPPAARPAAKPAAPRSTSPPQGSALSSSLDGDLAHTILYQAANGSAYFLDRLDVQLLLAEHGSPDALPEVITGPVLELDSHVQLLETRKRFKLMSHLPLLSTFSLVEVDCSGLVSPAILAKFAPQLRARQQKRDLAAVRDKKDQAEAERAQARHLAELRRTALVAQPQRQADIAPVNFPTLAPSNGPPAPAPSPEAVNSFSNVAKPNSAYHFPTLCPSEPVVQTEPTWPRGFAVPQAKSGGKKNKKKGKVVLLSTGGNRGSH